MSENQSINMFKRKSQVDIIQNGHGFEIWAAIQRTDRFTNVTCDGRAFS